MNDVHIRKDLLRDIIKTARAVIFDLDGVLIESEKFHFVAHRKALAEFGAKIDKAFYIAHGISTEPAIFYAKAFNQRELQVGLIEKILARKRKIYKELQEEGILPIEEAVALVNALHNIKIPLAVASAVDRDSVDSILQDLRIDRCFTVVVAGDDFPLRNKPFPDIYLKTAALLAINPVDCIAIEDSGNGAAAAIGAGMTCIVVPNEFTRKHDFSGAIVLPSFSEIQKLVVS